MDSIGKSFKIKTMNDIIINKLMPWISYIAKDDDNLKQELKDNIVMTGGAISSMILGELPNDYDIYFRSKETATKVANFYLAKLIEADPDRIKIEDTFDGINVFIKSAGTIDDTDTGIASNYQYFELLPPEELEKFVRVYRKKEYKMFEVKNITSNSMYLEGDINVILRFCGEPSIIHNNFDFTHTKNYFTFETGIVLNIDSVMATVTKELIYSGSKFPICSLFRIRKFVQRGWTITAGQIFKISWDVNNLNLTDLGVLR